MNSNTKLETLNELTEDARKYMAAIGKRGGSASKGKPHAKERARAAGIASGVARRAKKAAKTWDGGFIPKHEWRLGSWS